MAEGTLTCTRPLVAIGALALGVGIAVTAVAQQSKPSTAAVSAGSADATGRIVASAQALLETLDEAGRQKVQFPSDSPQKTKWSNLPSGIFEREGIRLADLTAPQRTAVMSLLSTALSAMGYRRVQNIMEGDEVLRKGSAWSRRRWPRGLRPGRFTGDMKVASPPELPTSVRGPRMGRM